MQEKERKLDELSIFLQQDELRNHLKKEIGYDGTVVAFQSSLDDLEVRQENKKKRQQTYSINFAFTRLQHISKEKETAQQQRDDMETKLNDLTQKQ